MVAFLAFLFTKLSVRHIYELTALFCKVHFLTLHKDKVVLKTKAAFLPKGVTPFHLNDDIVLPILCPARKNYKEIGQHCLDVLRAVKSA